MVDRYRCYGWDIRRGEMRREDDGDYVRHSDYARLQEQVETLRKERDEFRSCLATASGKLMVAEAERDRLREMTLRAADQCDKWVKETYDGGWSTHQVRGQCALAESLRLAALQKEPQP